VTSWDRRAVANRPITERRLFMTRQVTSSSQPLAVKIQVKQEIQTHLTKSANALAMVAAHDTSCIAKRLVYRPACMRSLEGQTGQLRQKCRFDVKVSFRAVLIVEWGARRL